MVVVGVVIVAYIVKYYGDGCMPLRASSRTRRAMHAAVATTEPWFTVMCIERLLNYSRCPGWPACMVDIVKRRLSLGPSSCKSSNR
jgi:hypothetical protein